VPSEIRHITVDCRAPFELARFWATVLGYADDPDNPNAPDDPEALIVDPSGRGPGLLFITVPESKTVKNRVHLDLQPLALRDVAVAEILDLGATLVADHRRPDGTGWATLADPEGNEFCVERSRAERTDSGAGPRDTGEREYPPIHTGDERSVLEGMLDWYREGVIVKVADLAPADARRSPVRSGTTIAGLVKHLALVEDSWFTHRFAGLPEPEPWASAPWDDDRDWEFHSAVDDDLADVVALYRAACERSRSVAAGRDLDDLAAVEARGRPFRLRFALVHLIEETARHLGHLDILREALDGTTGE
jgi:hypothetical protein